MPETKQITIKLAAKPQVNVVVTLPDGTPVVGATVEVSSVLWELLPLKYVTKYTTDYSGHVYVNGMLPGGYLIQAYKADDHAQAMPEKVGVNIYEKAVPNKLTMVLHAAPWYYTLKIKYPSVIGVLPAKIMSELIKIEGKYAGTYFEEIRVVDSTVEIDYRIVEESPFVVTGSIIVAIFVGLGFLILLGVVSWLLVERYKAPKPKKKFPCPIPGCDESFPDQAGLAIHLKDVHHDLHPWMCAYEGCDLRFSTEAEKVAHMEQFHFKELPLVKIVSIVAAFGAVAYVLGKMLSGGG